MASWFNEHAGSGKSSLALNNKAGQKKSEAEARKKQKAIEDIEKKEKKVEKQIQEGEIWKRGGSKVRNSYRSQTMLHIEYLLAQIGFDTAENEPSKIVLVYGLIPNILN